MEGVSWSASLRPEAFKRPRTTADTLNRLASFIARVESKQGLGKSCKQQPLQEDATLPCACRKCGERFSRGTELLTHQEIHHALPKPHRCPSCRRAFSLRSSLQLHNCDVSSQLFPAPARNSPTYGTSLVPNERADGSEFSQPRGLDRSLYACAPCGRGFMLKQALLHHQQAGCDPPRSDDPATPSPLDSPLASEEEDSSSNSLYLPDDGQNVCKFCSRTFRDEAACSRHNKMRHSYNLDTEISWESWNGQGQTGVSAKSKKDMFSCRSCDMVFNSTVKLSKHRKEEHSRGLKTDIEELPVVRLRRRTNNTYTCQVCSKVFFHHLSLWAHKKKHPVSEDDKSLTPNDSTKDCKLIKTPNLENTLIPCKVLVRECSLTHAVSAAKLCPPKLPKFTASFEPLVREDVCKDEEDFDDDDVEFPCPSCPEVFSQHSDLKAHAELHQSAVRRSRCSVCSSEMDSLKWSGAKKMRLYHCILCQTGFSTLEPFLTHCQNHLKAKVEEERDTPET